MVYRGSTDYNYRCRIQMGFDVIWIISLFLFVFCSCFVYLSYCTDKIVDFASSRSAISALAELCGTQQYLAMSYCQKCLQVSRSLMPYIERSRAPGWSTGDQIEAQSARHVIIENISPDSDAFITSLDWLHGCVVGGRVLYVQWMTTDDGSHRLGGRRRRSLDWTPVRSLKQTGPIGSTPRSPTVWCGAGERKWPEFDFVQSHEFSDSSISCFLETVNKISKHI